ncbi:MAG: sulfite exporter TauE/SafE family protein [Candidatus Improbicoccus pseudotrichonymphae]|uniref:Probable membrane transporter protein n=1 Tax=Candidatus Improbicoccus pseudotrichonymphae TaxID=3033792 RepID=A0AA48KVU1_9FIRM|nr:MAG: sulfite exporter TauE/SafE family protein [Candidatus Improbicoccus pseudotrichonymphae]
MFFLKKYENIFCMIFGFLAGVTNSMFGLGGGMIITPFLIKINFSTKEAHANSLCVTLLISIVSISVFFCNNYIKIINIDEFLIIFSGAIGAFAGTFLLKKINHNLLRKFFACFSFWAGCQLILN